MPVSETFCGIPDGERAAFIACKSHRARGRVLREIGAFRQGYYVSLLSPFRNLNHKGIYPVTRAELDRLEADPRLRKCFTVTRAPASHLHPCVV